MTPVKRTTSSHRRCLTAPIIKEIIMGSLQDMANAGFALAQSFIDFGLDTIAGFWNLATGSLHS